MLEHGIIEPAASPWASNVVLVKKKDGMLRFCIDYRKLNSVTYKDSYLLRLIDNCLNALSGYGSAHWIFAPAIITYQSQKEIETRLRSSPQDDVSDSQLCPSA